MGGGGMGFGGEKIVKAGGVCVTEVAGSMFLRRWLYGWLFMESSSGDCRHLAGFASGGGLADHH
eukprot:5210076-Pleurochrysis_carterae.AAC.1